MFFLQTLRWCVCGANFVLVRGQFHVDTRTAQMRRSERARAQLDHVAVAIVVECVRWDVLVFVMCAGGAAAAVDALRVLGIRFTTNQHRGSRSRSRRRLPGP